MFVRGFQCGEGGRQTDHVLVIGCRVHQRPQLSGQVDGQPWVGVVDVSPPRQVASSMAGRFIVKNWTWHSAKSGTVDKRSAATNCNDVTADEDVKTVNVDVKTTKWT